MFGGYIYLSVLYLGGESWVTEARNGNNIDYLFTSKEMDPETGLYYYGARYYDPRTSVWQSADPILGEYLPNVSDMHKAQKEGIDYSPETDLKGKGGIFTSANIDLYTYTHNNPINNVDMIGTDTIAADYTVRVPSWAGKLIFGDDFIGQGGALGFAFSFPGFTGGEFDAGFYVQGHGGGGDLGYGRISKGISYNQGSVHDLDGQGGKLSFTAGGGGMSADFNTEGLSGVGFHVGPGMNAGIAGTLTETYTARDVYNDIMNFIDGLDE